MMLEKLIPQYYEHKQELDKIDKVCKAENTDIKQEMKSQDIKDFEINGLIAKYIIKKRETMDEDKLLILLKERGYESVIRTKEYVDMDALENALYHNTIDTETIVEMDKCKNVKEVIELRVTKKKGEK